MGKSRGTGHQFLADGEWQSWNALLMMNRTVLRELDAGLTATHHMSVSEFDVLITLFNSPGARLRMSELATRAMLSNAGMTHLVTRLERDGLVRREVDPDDGRRWFAVLTLAGDDALSQARLTHNAVLRRTIFASMTSAEQKTLRGLWQRLHQTS